MDLNDKTIDVNLRHTELVKNLAKPGEEILSTINKNDLKVLLAISKLAERTSDCLDVTVTSAIEAVDSRSETVNTPEELMHLLHMSIGMSGEHGELLDAIKKSIIYQKPLDRDNCIEEVGDFLFYFRGMQGYKESDLDDFNKYVMDDEFKVILDYVGTTVEECLEANIAKLQERYSSGKYSDQQAQDRADKS